MAKSATYKNEGQSKLLIESEKHEVIGKRVLPGSRVELPVEYGDTLRKYGLKKVADTADEEQDEE